MGECRPWMRGECNSTERLRRNGQFSAIERYGVLIYSSIYLVKTNICLIPIRQRIVLKGIKYVEAGVYIQLLPQIHRPRRYQTTLKIHDGCLLPDRWDCRLPHSRTSLESRCQSKWKGFATCQWRILRTKSPIKISWERFYAGRKKVSLPHRLSLCSVKESDTGHVCLSLTSLYLAIEEQKW